MNDISAPERILVAAVADESGARAVQWADKCARSLDIRLVVASSFHNTSSERNPDDERIFLEQHGTDFADWIAGLGVEHAQVAFLGGDLDDQIVEAARFGDLVVVGVERHEGHTSWALGSEPHRFAHRLPCPLVLVPSAPVLSYDAPIVVGLDGTPGNELVIDWAKAFGVATGRGVHAVYASNPMYETFDNAGDLGVEERHARDEAGREFVEFHERPGDPDVVLGDVARDVGAFLTVVGARQEHSFGGLLLGRIVDHLLHSPPGPLAVLTHDFEKAVGS